MRINFVDRLFRATRQHSAFIFYCDLLIFAINERKIVFGKRTGHLNLYTLCTRDSWTCIYFIFTDTSSATLYSGLSLSSKQNTRAFTYFNFRPR